MRFADEHFYFQSYAFNLNGIRGLHFHFSLLCIREGNGNPLQCSCLENPRDGVAQIWT